MRNKLGIGVWFFQIESEGIKAKADTAEASAEGRWVPKEDEAEGTGA